MTLKRVDDLIEALEPFRNHPVKVRLGDWKDAEIWSVDFDTDGRVGIYVSIEAGQGD